MEQVRFEIQEEIPVIAEVDVLVVGGGPGGLGASVMAARAGADTLLVERYGVLGGMSAQGEVTPFMANDFVEEGKDSAVVLDRPVFVEWMRKMGEYLPNDLQREIGAFPGTEAPGWGFRMISKDVAPLAMEELCLESGVKILYHHQLVRTVVEDGTVKLAVFSSKSGFVAIRAKAFVDATGDADLTALSGGAFELGGPTGHCQPMTLCFKLDHMDWDKFRAADIQALYEKARAEGKVHCPRENVLAFRHFDGDVAHFNTTRVIHKSAISGEELSEAELEAHAQVREIIRWLRAEMPGFENARVRSIGQHIGVRESRRIRGKAYATVDVFRERRKFDDAIVRCNYMVDIHSPDGSGTEIVSMSNREYYELPYGCLVPESLKNVAVGSRSISVDHALHSSIRVMPPVCSIGQAAGVAAALSVKSGIPVSELNGKKVREKLVEMGAYL